MGNESVEPIISIGLLGAGNLPGAEGGGGARQNQFGQLQAVSVLFRRMLAQTQVGGLAEAGAEQQQS